MMQPKLGAQPMNEVAIDKDQIIGTVKERNKFRQALVHIRQLATAAKGKSAMAKIAEVCDETLQDTPTHEASDMNVKEIAKRWLDENIKADEWPEDDWASLSDDYDMNIYIDDDGKKRATVFPVVDNETNLEVFIEIV